MPNQVSEIDLEALRATWPALSDEERAEAFSLLGEDDAQAFFGSLTPADQAGILKHLSNGKAAIWMRMLAPDDAADVLQESDAEQRKRLEAMLPEPTRREVQALLAYAEDDAGGLMSPRYVRLRPDVTIEVAIRYLRQQIRKNPETLYYVYVLDAEQRLLGVISFRELFAAPGDALVADVMRRDPITVHEATDQEEVARIIETNDLLALPVVDDEGRVKGIVTVDDIVDVIQEEATEDIQKIGGTEALRAPYLDVSFPAMIRKRGGWLSVLFIGELLTTVVMGYFEQELAQAVVLALFVPLIISSGGNSGSQATTLIIRSMALAELRLRDWWRVIRRELGSGLTLGAWLGLIGFLRVVLWHHAGWAHFGEHYVLLGLTVWLSLVGVVSLGTLAGSMLPFLMRLLGFDPAVSSAPFVATLVDVTGLIIYFSIAAVVLRGTLL
ncbi:MAG: magnesium transporter [Phycisphaerae bacterium]|nr:magnesium transporter [Phycisphaerae bacterium]